MTILPDAISWKLQLYYVAHLAFAFLLGACIGWERELAGKEAGIRTFGGIAMGSAAFSILSPLLGFADNSRIAAQIVLGIGFLGSGLFVRRDDGQSGLTTAASLWCSAAVGTNRCSCCRRCECWRRSRSRRAAIPTADRRRRG